MGTVRMTKGRIKLIQSGKYDPNEKHTKAVLAYLNYKEFIGWVAKRNAPREPNKSAIEASMTFYMPIPQSWSKKKQQAHTGDNVPHISKPDIDNLEKGLYDSLNGIIFKDDGQIYKVKEKAKYYSDTPRIECEFTEV
jgi:Holliday junction resolvase RusA-like endonuclease